MLLSNWLRRIRKSERKWSAKGRWGRRPANPQKTFATSTEVLEVRSLLSLNPVLASAGSDPTLIYRDDLAGSFSGTSETDTYTVSLDAGQTLTVLFSTDDADLQGSIEVSNPSSVSLGTASAVAAGGEVSLQTLSISSPGTYTITTSNLAGAGDYEVTLLLNTALDNEVSGGASNDTIGTAQDLASSSLTLPGGASRLAAVGDATGSADFYSFTLSAGQFATIAGEAPGTGTLSIEFLRFRRPPVSRAIAGATDAS